MILVKGKLYDALKFVAQLVLPALATLYFTLAGIWGLPAAEQVVGTIVAIDTFLGVILQLSSTAYSKTVAEGTLAVIESGRGKKTYSLELDGDPEYELEGKESAVFRVKKSKIGDASPPRQKRRV